MVRGLEQQLSGQNQQFLIIFVVTFPEPWAEANIILHG